MKIHALIITMSLLSAIFGCRKSHDGTDEGDPTYQAVMDLPDGIKVVHTPTRVYAGEGGRSGYRYTWTYETAVRSTVGDLEIVEFGSFMQDGRKWVLGNYTGKPFTGKDFAEWYSCTDGKLIGERTFSDPMNWTGAETLYESTSMWYFVGRNPEGKKFKGVELVTTLAELEREPDDAP